MPAFQPVQQALHLRSCSRLCFPAQPAPAGGYWLMRFCLRISGISAKRILLRQPEQLVLCPSLCGRLRFSACAACSAFTFMRHAPLPAQPALADGDWLVRFCLRVSGISAKRIMLRQPEQLVSCPGLCGRRCFSARVAGSASRHNQHRRAAIKSPSSVRPGKTCLHHPLGRRSP